MSNANDELDALADALEQLSTGRALTHRNDELMPPGERLCPIFSEKMQTFETEGVSLDGCPGHGVWLDTGEMKLLFERLQLQAGSTRKLDHRAGRRDIAAKTRTKLAAAVSRAASMTQP